MGTVSFKLDMFEGPLDLLLHLIVKHKLDIMDIEISLLLEQYLEYIEGLDHEDYEYAGEFLEMAARLIYIKTVSLLPKPEEAQELKAELQGKILEYSICKQLAAKLREQYIQSGVYVRDELVIEEGSKAYELTHAPEELVTALMLAGRKKAIPEPKIQAKDFGGIVSHKIYSVTAKILFVLKRLYKTGQFEMDRLYDGMKEKSERIATFLAILELTKSGRITLNDDNSIIYFKRRTKAEREIEHSTRPKTDEQKLLEEEGEFIPDEDEAVQEEYIKTENIPENIRYAVFEPYEDKEEKRLKPLVKRSSERVYKASEIIFLDEYKKENSEADGQKAEEESSPELTQEDIKPTEAIPTEEKMGEVPAEPAPAPEAPEESAPVELPAPASEPEPVKAAVPENEKEADAGEQLPDVQISFRPSYYGVRYYYGYCPAFNDKRIYAWKYYKARENR